MDSTNASAPLLQVEGETQLPPTLVETTIVKVEVTDTGKNENSVNGSGVGSGEGSVAVDGGGGEAGDVDSEVMVRRKRGRPRKHLVESRECLPSLQNIVPKRGRGRPPGIGKLQLLAAMGEDIFGRMLSVVQTSPRAVCILSAVEERTSRVAPNGHSKRRRVSTNQTVHSDLYINLEVSSGFTKKGPLGCSQRSTPVEESFNKSDSVHSDLYINLEVSSSSMAKGLVKNTSKVQAVSKDIPSWMGEFALLLSRCAEYLFSNSDTVSEYVLSSCCKEIIAGKTGIGGAIVK
ncbi:hypothetical protein RHSIM_Rhsim10G0095800 [Rhododendron simsii]|uniref:Uncharacterized protein n=1 Tax=Rhododendron simsii TaxID=118357 RepID=A0A834G9R2_RHOSS|nr:hypothetical protein RHSIM_Rhsim10G0095800 [Rhododendron simsii]